MKLKITAVVNTVPVSVTIDCADAGIKERIRSNVCSVLITNVDWVTEFEVKEIP